MNCPQCGGMFGVEVLSGEVCHCQSEPPPSESAILIGAPSASLDSQNVSERATALEYSVEQDLSVKPAEADASNPSSGIIPIAEPPSDAWRDELSLRLDRFRARRKMPPPRYPSLMLTFGPVGAPSHENRANGANVKPAPLDSFEPVSDQSLALSEMRPTHTEFKNIEKEGLHRSQGESARPVATAGAKIIEFPRPLREPAAWDSFTWGPPTPPPDQLAEPVGDRPRILDVPEIVPPEPALGGITIEPAESREAEKRPGIDFPLQSASLPRRLVAAIVDGLIIILASAMFGSIFWKVTTIRPPLPQIVAMATALLCLLWAAYQYLLIVYASTTPGLRLAGLKLTRFNGTATTRSLRRWRVLASYLSAASLGMGYAWLFLDEDILCWHDRTTHTYFAPSKR
jgi:uncharacterized RDD family membrane protein YckC